jgi:hypothetical protein
LEEEGGEAKRSTGEDTYGNVKGVRRKEEGSLVVRGKEGCLQE